LKHKDCKHDPCTVLCHPGACPPCNINVPVKCHCAKETKLVPCQVAARTTFSCEQPCGRALNCGRHWCEQPCHPGPCAPCDEPLKMPCHCTKEAKEAVCGDPAYSCGQVCGAPLDCGSHSCEKPCHEGKCLPCQRDPSRVRYCPSGHNKIEDLLGRQREACTEPIPVCDALCQRFLPCGRHQCIKQCHTDECMRCEEMVAKKCVCGKTSTTVACYKVNYPDAQRKKYMTQEEMDAIDNLECKRVCNAMKKCNKHHCKEVCCPVKRAMGRDGDPEGRHLCMITCNKQLSCGKHPCGDFCHLGFCKPCKRVSLEPLHCPCGIAKLDPPI